MPTPNNNKPKRQRFPNFEKIEFKAASAEETLEFILGIPLLLWKLIGTSIAIVKDRKVTLFDLKYVGEPECCPLCGQRMTVKDYKERKWRHANYDDTVSYIRARIPRFECKHCNTVRQAYIPWADENVTYTRRFMEVAIELMSKMSIKTVSELLMCSWETLDNIVGRVVDKYLDKMDLSAVVYIRIDETSAKRRHRYITVVTDVITGDIIFITKGKDKKVMKELADWLLAHNGNPENIRIVASDFGDAFLSGTREYFPNAVPVLDTFHLIQLGNKKLDADRASVQTNGTRFKNVRYALLRNEENYKPGDAELVESIRNEFEVLGRSYMMNMSLRAAFGYPYAELTRVHLIEWVKWVEEEGTKGFKALAKTVKANLEGIVNAVKYGINNGYQEGLNGRIQFSKRIANGYHKETSLIRIVFFRDAVRNGKAMA